MSEKTLDGDMASKPVKTRGDLKSAQATQFWNAFCEGEAPARHVVIKKSGPEKAARDSLSFPEPN